MEDIISEFQKDFNSYLKSHQFKETYNEEDKEQCSYYIHRMKNDNYGQERWKLSKEVSFGKEYNDYEVIFQRDGKVLCECIAASMGKKCRHVEMVEIFR